MKKEIRNLPASVQDRLRNKARELQRPYGWLLQYYASERLLYRLSKSEHGQKFVLKGGLIFIGWGIPLRRHTKDIDLRAYTSNNIDDVMRIIKDLCIQNVEPDGMIYEADSVRAEVITEEADYPGIRVHLWARLGETTRVPMQIDMGFSDEIVPPANTVIYPIILADMPGPTLQGYPREAVVAEKLHCIVYRGSINSRMKDFYDLWFISQQHDFKGVILQNAIINTFKNRGTPIPDNLPVGLSDDYAKENERQWQAFLKPFNPEWQDIKDFLEVIRTLRDFLIPVLRATIINVTFNSYWKAGANWTTKNPSD